MSMPSGNTLTNKPQFKIAPCVIGTRLAAFARATVLDILIAVWQAFIFPENDGKKSGLQ